jgi:hypothetical protein
MPPSKESEGHSTNIRREATDIRRKDDEYSSEIGERAAAAAAAAVAAKEVATAGKNRRIRIKSAAREKRHRRRGRRDIWPADATWAL